MKTLTEQYRLIKEDKGHKGVFLKEAKAKYPNLLTNSSTFKEATTILKQKNIISENYIDLQPINNPIERKKEGFENAFANFLAEAEAKAEEKKVSKEVEEAEEHNYDYADKKDPNNMIFGQIQMGYYFEMKQEKNADKTIDEIKDIVFKNLEKDPIYYTKNGQFGVEVGYTEDNVSLGVPKELKGEYKSSGYGKIEGESKFKYVVNENKKPVNEIAIAGGLVTGGGFTSANYMDFYGLNEADDDAAEAKKIEDSFAKSQASVEKIAATKMFEGEAPVHIEALAKAADVAYEEGMDVEDILDFVRDHLRLKGY